ncbi:MAG: FAD-dependent thymidylate synthase [Desulfobulbus propionicus]|nr:MAG: FAD-dependent thymidylate synthase [Desulfobulbus propionicus]PIE60439.1 MAG: FAD-dependent thymidylate synthase [Desulfobulbus propionicus]
MIIIKPSYTILHELDQQSLPVRIEYSGRICYKSEERITEDSAIPFVRKMAAHGHNSVLEMGVVTFRVYGATQKQIDALFFCQPKYMHIEVEQDNTLLVTASIRSYKEFYVNNQDNEIGQALIIFLAARHPYFYEKIAVPEHGAENLTIKKLELSEVEQLEGAKLALHRYLGIKFIVNRAVTHELVRHRPCSFLQESQRYCRYSTDRFGNEVTFVQPLFFEQGSPEFELWKKAMEETEQLYLKLLETAPPQAARTVLPNSCKTEIIVYTNLLEWQHIVALRTPQNADPSMREVMVPLSKELKQLYPTIF